MKLAFYRPAQTNTTPVKSVSYSAGVPVGSGSTLRAHTEAFNLVGNSGNMIHRMAMIQLLEFDRAASAQISLQKLLNKLKDPGKVAALLADRYDGVVITMSNVLRMKSAEPGMPELIRALKIPVYCLGIGMQDNLPPGDALSVDPGMLDFMRALDEKAALFGVRGHDTLSWLQSVGIRNAKALGCPSMFVYPRKILGLQAPVHPKRIITAGHLALKADPDGRIQKLARGFNGIYAAYVFQGETKNFNDIMDLEGVYDEATQALDPDVIRDLFRKKTGQNLPFSEFYSFNEVSAWRSVSRMFDAYIGDRIHGGVAAMQAGVPALILHTDARVRELANYHGIPACTLDQFSNMGALDALREHLNEEAIVSFKGLYAQRLSTFNTALCEAGLKRVA